MGLAPTAARCQRKRQANRNNQNNPALDLVATSPRIPFGRDTFSVMLSTNLLKHSHDVISLVVNTRSIQSRPQIA
ncbi:hypothetical protein VTI28DRAFT_4199 [Corynascus sepedonium]